ncbi:fungal-specific transcription factor domain-containing protein, partial [Penicillium waksmanii]|uniref:fungal-specific transcription factor domain-containing protein n=1 Tax=Penicillium waksmanii TaxID=69791 RepID=UPI0025497286
CHRCHSQKVKYSGEKLCSRCLRAGYTAQYRYINRNHKIRVDKSYLEQLIQDSQELQDQQTRQTYRPPTPSSSLKPITTLNNPLQQPKSISSTIPDYTYISITDLLVFYLPRQQYTDKNTLKSLFNIKVQWLSLVYAKLLIKTALGYLNPAFYLVLRKEIFNILYNIYQRRDFNNPGLLYKYFALFTVGQAFLLIGPFYLLILVLFLIILTIPKIYNNDIYINLSSNLLCDAYPENFSDNNSSLENKEITLIMRVLSKAYIYALYIEEYISRSMLLSSYTFPAFLFSLALMLTILSLLSLGELGDPNDIILVNIVAEILRVLSTYNSLAAKDLYKYLQ